MHSSLTILAFSSVYADLEFRFCPVLPTISKHDEVLHRREKTWIRYCFLSPRSAANQDTVSNEKDIDRLLPPRASPVTAIKILRQRNHNRGHVLGTVHRSLECFTPLRCVSCLPSLRRTRDVPRRDRKWLLRTRFLLFFASSSTILLPWQ